MQQKTVTGAAVYTNNWQNICVLFLFLCSECENSSLLERECLKEKEKMEDKGLLCNNSNNNHQ